MPAASVAGRSTPRTSSPRSPERISPEIHIETFYQFDSFIDFRASSLPVELVLSYQVPVVHTVVSGCGRGRKQLPPHLHSHHGNEASDAAIGGA